MSTAKTVLNRCWYYVYTDDEDAERGVVTFEVRSDNFDGSTVHEGTLRVDHNERIAGVIVSEGEYMPVPYDDVCDGHDADSIVPIVLETQAAIFGLH